MKKKKAKPRNPKLKIPPWLLKPEELELMPGVTVEQIKEIRYGKPYPAVWYEKYPATPFGYFAVARYIYTTRKRTYRNSIIRAYLFRAFSQIFKRRRGFSTRAYQHAGFWLFTDLPKYLEWTYRIYKVAEERYYQEDKRRWRGNKIRASYKEKDTRYKTNFTRTIRPTGNHEVG